MEIQPVLGIRFILVRRFKEGSPMMTLLSDQTIKSTRNMVLREFSSYEWSFDPSRTASTFSDETWYNKLFFKSLCKRIYLKNSWDT